MPKGNGSLGVVFNKWEFSDEAVTGFWMLGVLAILAIFLSFSNLVAQNQWSSPEFGG
jgi:hypothetical protein